MRRSTYERALLDPSAVFRDPEEILAVADLTRDEKERLLLSWQQDADRLAGSEVENMGGGEPSTMLDRTSWALLALRESGVAPMRGPEWAGTSDPREDLPAEDLALAGSTPVGPQRMDDRPTGVGGADPGSARP